MNVRELKDLVRKFGGDPTGKNTVAELLDCLCMCDVGGGVTSWNDLTDKPFYKNVSTETIFDEVVSGFTAVSSGSAGEEGVIEATRNSIPLAFGKTYRVTFDGESYLLEGKPGDYSEVTLGSSGAWKLSTQNVKFCINEYGTIYALGEVDSEHSVKIETYDEVKKILSLDFLPDGYAGKKNIGDFIVLDANITDFTKSGGVYYKTQVPTNKRFEANKTYSVFIDGVEYLTTARAGISENIIGADTSYLMPEDTPFYMSTLMIGYGVNVECNIYLKTDTASHTIKIVEHDSEEDVLFDSKYLPKAEAIADVTEAPTAVQFNALLASLREAGYLAT